MNRIFLLLAVVAGATLSGCVAENTSADETETDRYIRQNTDWRENRPIFGASYNQAPNDTENR